MLLKYILSRLFYSALFILLLIVVARFGFPIIVGLCLIGCIYLLKGTITDDYDDWKKKNETRKMTEK
jgi:hypothetical protein